MKVLPVEQPRIFGIETEYGLQSTVIENLGITNDKINAGLPSYLHSSRKGFNEYGRIYADQGINFEVSTPELVTVEGLLAAHFAGESLARIAVRRIFKNPDEKDPVKVYKSTLDSANKPRGEHDNLIVGSEFDRRSQAILCTHLASSIILTGPGMTYKDNYGALHYAIDQRGLVMSGDIINGSSVNTKPFMKSLANIRDFDGSYRTQRLQIVSRSQNMFAFPVVARIFNTSAVLRLIEQNAYPSDMEFADPMAAINIIARDPSLTTTIEMSDGKHLTAAQVQYELLSAALKLDIPIQEEEAVVKSLKIVSDLINGEREKWADHLEWVSKYDLLRRQAERQNKPLPTMRNAQTNIVWHELSPRSPAVLLRRLGHVAMFPSTEAIVEAKRRAPDQTRGLIRAQRIAEAAHRGAKIETMEWNYWKFSDMLHPEKMNDAYATKHFHNEDLPSREVA